MLGKRQSGELRKKSGRLKSRSQQATIRNSATLIRLLALGLLADLINEI